MSNKVVSKLILITSITLLFSTSSIACVGKMDPSESTVVKQLDSNAIVSVAK